MHGTTHAWHIQPKVALLGQRNDLGDLTFVWTGAAFFSQSYFNFADIGHIHSIFQTGRQGGSEDLGDWGLGRVLLPPRLQYVDSVFVLYEHGYLDSMLDEVGECRVRGVSVWTLEAGGGEGRGRGSEVKSILLFQRTWTRFPGPRLEDSQLPVTPVGSKGTFTFAQIHIYINNNKC